MSPTICGRCKKLNCNIRRVMSGTNNAKQRPVSSRGAMLSGAKGKLFQSHPLPYSAMSEVFPVGSGPSVVSKTSDIAGKGKLKNSIPLMPLEGLAGADPSSPGNCAEMCQFCDAYVDAKVTVAPPYYFREP